MTAYIRVAAAATAASVGAICGLHAHPVPPGPAPAVQTVQSVFYAPRISCTLTWTGRDAVVFTSDPCTAVPGFTSLDGYAPLIGDPRFGVVCALRSGDAFDIIANRGGTNSAGLLCDALRAKGWSEDPDLGSSYNTVLQETSRVVRT